MTLLPFWVLPNIWFSSIMNHAMSPSLQVSWNSRDHGRILSKRNGGKSYSFHGISICYLISSSVYCWEKYPLSRHYPLSRNSLISSNSIGWWWCWCWCWWPWAQSEWGTGPFHVPLPSPKWKTRRNLVTPFVLFLYPLFITLKGRKISGILCRDAWKVSPSFC